MAASADGMQRSSTTAAGSTHLFWRSTPSGGARWIQGVGPAEEQRLRHPSQPSEGHSWQHTASRFAATTSSFDADALADFEVLRDNTEHHLFFIDGPFELVTNRNAPAPDALQLLWTRRFWTR